MSRVISLRLKDDQAAQLDRLARQFERSPSATAALLLAEKLTEEQFPCLEFRDTILGRELFVKGTRLKIWQVVMVARGYGMDAARVAKELMAPAQGIESALAYAEANPDEINRILEEVESFTFEDLKRIVPWAKKALE